MRNRLSTEALARASARRPWMTIGVWALVLLLSGILSATLLGKGLTTEQEFTNNPEAKRADALLEGLRGPRKALEVVIIRSDRLTVDAPAFQQFVDKLYGDLEGLGSGVIASATSYPQSRSESLVSTDRHTTIIPIAMAGTLDTASDNIGQVHEITHAANGQEGFTVLITGDASSGKDFEGVAQRDLRSGEFLGIPVALMILALVFGAIVASLIPLLLAGVSIVVALGAAALVGQIFHLSFFVTNMITMMGLAIGIDYSLFVVSRYREERGRGRVKLEAIAWAGKTATRSVLFSGMTVVLALLGMLIVPLNIFGSLGAGAILVVIASVLGSLTLLPAVLSLVGDRVNSLRIPLLQRQTTTDASESRGGFWDWQTRTVMRHPVPSLMLAVVVLVAAAIPYFSIKIGAAGVSTLPDGLESKEAFIILGREFSAGLVGPAEIVVKGDINSAPVQQAMQRLEETVKSDPSFGPVDVQVASDSKLALMSSPVAGDATSDTAIDAVKRLRHQYIPQAFTTVQAEVFVTGATAYNLDYFGMTKGYMRIVFPFVLGLSFLLLMVVFRSLVVPAKAVLMNLLSVGAAYGLLVLVFQKGFGAGLLGFQKVSEIEAWLPLFLFSMLFGLSMDYHVFLLSRIRERFDQTHDNSESVAFGVRTTAGIITGAALIMVAVFAGFASGDLVMFQQMGFGLAVAVLLDATIIRSVLVPASMRLLGAVNWYLPRWLHWLPDFRVEGRGAMETEVSQAGSPAPSQAQGQ